MDLLAVTSIIAGTVPPTNHQLARKSTPVARQVVTLKAVCEKNPRKIVLSTRPGTLIRTPSHGYHGYCLLCWSPPSTSLPCQKKTHDV